MGIDRLVMFLTNSTSKCLSLLSFTSPDISVCRHQGGAAVPSDEATRHGHQRSCSDSDRRSGACRTDITYYKPSIKIENYCIL